MYCRRPDGAAAPSRLGCLEQYGGYEHVLWKLLDSGIVPRYSPLVDGAGDFCVWRQARTAGTSAVDGAPPTAEASSSAATWKLGGALPDERAHRKRAQIEAIAQLVHALIVGAGGSGTVVDFCGGSGPFRTSLRVKAHASC